MPRRPIQDAYDGDPALNDVAAVRFEVGDTVEGDYLLSEEEINYALHLEGTILKAAARCAEHLAARHAREAGERTASVTIDHSVKYKHFSMLARKLRARSMRPPVMSRTLSGEAASQKGRFSVGMHDNIRSGFASASGRSSEFTE